MDTVASAREALDDQVIQELAASLRGALLRPGDTEYDAARAIQNGMIDRRPALIARCSGAADVIAAVNVAREHGLLLSVKGGGHNVAGNAVNDGGIVIDLTPMRGVHVDPASRIAHVQGGATWADLDRETQVFGLAAPGGVVSTTGVAGLTLHGGMGHLRSRHGLSIDNLRSVQIVTADGQLRTASANENPDLFWAVRGAGANFGVVTSFEFQLHPVGPVVYLCAPVYALEDAPGILRRWRELIAGAPDELTPIAIFWSVQPGFPEELVGRDILILAAVYAGPVEEGERIAAPLRMLGSPLLDLSGPAPFAGIQSSFDGFFPKGDRYYWKSTWVDALPDELIDALCALAAARPSPRTTMDIWPQRGAAARPDASETAFGARRPFLLAFESSWTDPGADDANVAFARDAVAAMRRFDAGGVYLNFPGFGEEQEDLTRAAYGDNYARLRELKRRWDPDNLFRMNQNIRPRHSARTNERTTTMFGTIALVKALPGKEEELVAFGETWTRERGAETGQLAEYVFKLKDRPGEYAIVGIFADEAAYYANAADPETDRWYRRMRALLAEDPSWHDGEVIAHELLAGI